MSGCAHMTIEVHVPVPHCRRCGGIVSPKTGKVLKKKLPAEERWGWGS